MMLRFLIVFVSLVTARKSAPKVASEGAQMVFDDAAEFDPRIAQSLVGRAAEEAAIEAHKPDITQTTGHVSTVTTTTANVGVNIAIVDKTKLESSVGGRKVVEPPSPVEEEEDEESDLATGSAATGSAEEDEEEDEEDISATGSFDDEETSPTGGSSEEEEEEEEEKNAPSSKYPEDTLDIESILETVDRYHNLRTRGLAFGEDRYVPLDAPCHDEYDEYEKISLALEKSLQEWENELKKNSGSIQVPERVSKLVAKSSTSSKTLGSCVRDSECADEFACKQFNTFRDGDATFRSGLLRASRIELAEKTARLDQIQSLLRNAQDLVGVVVAARDFNAKGNKIAEEDMKWTRNSRNNTGLESAEQEAKTLLKCNAHMEQAVEISKRRVVRLDEALRKLAAEVTVLKVYVDVLENRSKDAIARAATVTDRNEIDSFNADDVLGPGGTEALKTFEDTVSLISNRLDSVKRENMLSDVASRREDSSVADFKERENDLFSYESTATGMSDSIRDYFGATALAGRESEVESTLQKLLDEVQTSDDVSATGEDGESESEDELQGFGGATGIKELLDTEPLDLYDGPTGVAAESKLDENASRDLETFEREGVFKYATGSNGMTGSDAELRDRIHELSETTHRPGSLARVHRVHEWNKDADDDLVDKISKEIVVNGASPEEAANVAGENDLPTYVAAAHAASDSAGMSSRDSRILARDFAKQGGGSEEESKAAWYAATVAYGGTGLESFDMNHPPAVGEFDLERVRGNLPGAPTHDEISTEFESDNHDVEPFAETGPALVTPHVVPEDLLASNVLGPTDDAFESGHRIVNTGNSMSDDVLRRAHELASSSGPEEDEHAELVSRLDDLLDTRAEQAALRAAAASKALPCKDFTITDCYMQGTGYVADRKNYDVDSGEHDPISSASSVEESSSLLEMSEDEVPVTLKTSPKQLERTATVSVRASNRIRGLLERMSKSVNIASSNAKNEYGEVSDEIRDDTVLLKGLMDKSDESSSHLVRRAFERADEGAEISKKKAKRLFEDLQEYKKERHFQNWLQSKEQSTEEWKSTAKMLRNEIEGAVSELESIMNEQKAHADAEHSTRKQSLRKISDIATETRQRLVEALRVMRDADASADTADATLRVSISELQEAREELERWREQNRKDIAAQKDVTDAKKIELENAKEDAENRMRIAEEQVDRTEREAAKARERVKKTQKELRHLERVATLKAHIATRIFRRLESKLESSQKELSEARQTLLAARERQSDAEKHEREVRKSAADSAERNHREIQETTSRIASHANSLKVDASRDKSEAEELGRKARDAWVSAEQSLGCISSAGTPLEEALKEIAPYDPMDAASDEVKSVFREAERNYQDMVEKVKQESKKLDELKKTRTEIEEEIKARTAAAATSFLELDPKALSSVARGGIEKVVDDTSQLDDVLSRARSHFHDQAHAEVQHADMNLDAMKALHELENKHDNVQREIDENELELLYTRKTLLEAKLSLGMHVDGASECLDRLRDAIETARNLDREHEKALARETKSNQITVRASQGAIDALKHLKAHQEEEAKEHEARIEAAVLTLRRSESAAEDAESRVQEILKIVRRYEGLVESVSGTRLSDHTLKYEDEDTFEATGMMSGEYAATGVYSPTGPDRLVDMSDDADDSENDATDKIVELDERIRDRNRADRLNAKADENLERVGRESTERVNMFQKSFDDAENRLEYLRNLEETQNRREPVRVASAKASEDFETLKTSHESWRDTAKDVLEPSIAEDFETEKQDLAKMLESETSAHLALIRGDTSNLKQLASELGACSAMPSQALRHLAVLQANDMPDNGNDDADLLRAELRFAEQREQSLSSRAQEVAVLERDFFNDVVRLALDAASHPDDDEEMKTRIQDLKNRIEDLKAFDTETSEEAAHKEQALEQILVSAASNAAEVARKSKMIAENSEREAHILASRLRMRAHNLEASKEMYEEQKRNADSKLQDAIENLRETRVKMRSDMAAHLPHDVFDYDDVLGVTGSDAATGGMTGPESDDVLDELDMEFESRKFELNSARHAATGASYNLAEVEREIKDAQNEATQAEEERRTRSKSASDASETAKHALERLETYTADEDKFKELVRDLIDSDAADPDKSAALSEEVEKLQHMVGAQDVIETLSEARASRQLELTVQEQLRFATSLAQVLIRIRGNLHSRQRFKSASEKLVAAGISILSKQSEVSNDLSDSMKSVDGIGLAEEEIYANGRRVHVFDRILDARSSLDNAMEELVRAREEVKRAVQNRTDSYEELQRTSEELAQFHNAEDLDEEMVEKAHDRVVEVDNSLRRVEDAYDQEKERVSYLKNQRRRLRGKLEEMGHVAEEKIEEGTQSTNSKLEEIESKRKALEDAKMKEIEDAMTALNGLKQQLQELENKYTGENSIEHLHSVAIEANKKAEESCAKAVQISKMRLTSAQSFFSGWEEKKEKSSEQCHADTRDAEEATTRYNTAMRKIHVERTKVAKAKHEIKTLRAEKDSIRESAEKSKTEASKSQSQHSEGVEETLNSERTPILETLRVLKKSSHSAEARLAHLEHTGTQLVSLRDEYVKRMHGVSTELDGAHEMWETAQRAQNKAAHLAHVAAAAALSAYKARLHAEQSVKDHQSLLKKANEYGQEVLGDSDLDFGDDASLQEKRRDATESMYESLKAEHDSVEIAAKNARRARELLVEARKSRHEALNILGGAHNDAVSTKYGLQREIEAMQSKISTLRKSTRKPNDLLVSSTRDEYLEAQNDLQTRKNEVQEEIERLGLDGESKVLSDLDSALDNILERSKTALESINDALTSASDARFKAVTIPENRQEERFAEVGSKLEVGARMAMMRAGESVKSNQMQQQVYDARDSVRDAQDAIREATERGETNMTIESLRNAATAQIEELKNAQSKMDEHMGLVVETIPGPYIKNEASAACELHDLELCTHAQMAQAFLQGHHGCECGWTSTSLDHGNTFVVEYVSQIHVKERCQEDSWGIVLCGEKSPDLIDEGIEGFAAHCCGTKK